VRVGSGLLNCDIFSIVVVSLKYDFATCDISNHLRGRDLQH